jgi:hypothetical protein
VHPWENERIFLKQNYTFIKKTKNMKTSKTRNERVTFLRRVRERFELS